MNIGILTFMNSYDLKHYLDHISINILKLHIIIFKSTLSHLNIINNFCIVYSPIVLFVILCYNQYKKNGNSTHIITYLSLPLAHYSKL